MTSNPRDPCSNLNCEARLGLSPFLFVVPLNLPCGAARPPLDLLPILLYKQDPQSPVDPDEREGLSTTPATRRRCQVLLDSGGGWTPGSLHHSWSRDSIAQEGLIEGTLGIDMSLGLRWVASFHKASFLRAEDFPQMIEECDLLFCWEVHRWGTWTTFYGRPPMMHQPDSPDGVGPPRMFRGGPPPMSRGGCPTRTFQW